MPGGGVKKLQKPLPQVDAVAAGGVVPARASAIAAAVRCRPEPFDGQVLGQVIQAKIAEEEQRGGADPDGVVSEFRRFRAGGVQIGVWPVVFGPCVPGEVPQRDGQAGGKVRRRCTGQ